MPVSFFFTSCLIKKYSGRLVPNIFSVNISPADSGSGAVYGCGSMTARLLRVWIRNPPGAWTSVSCECCVLLGRILCLDCGVSECDREASIMRRLSPSRDDCAMGGGGEVSPISADKEVFLCVLCIKYHHDQVHLELNIF